MCITLSLESMPRFIPSASPVMSRLTSFSCQLISVIITTLVTHHSFTISLQAQNLPFQKIPSHLNTSHSPGLPSESWGRTGLIVCFSLIFLFVPCGRLSWLVLHVSFSLHVKYTVSYRITWYGKFP